MIEVNAQTSKTIDPAPGVYVDMPDEQYFAIDMASRSSLKAFERSAMHAAYYAGNPMVPSPAMEFGTAFHLLLLEPEKFSSRVFCVGDSKPRKGSKKYLELNEQHKRGIFITSEESDNLMLMREAVMATSIGNALFSGEGMNEFVVIFDDPDTGIRCKAKIDRYAEGKVVDLKTTKDASIESFRSTDSRFQYHAQAWFYLHALNLAVPVDPLDFHRKFVYAVVESEPPFGVSFFEPDIVAIDEGKNLCKKWLKQLKQAREQRLWPGYPDKIQTLELAPWLLAKRRREEMTFADVRNWAAFVESPVAADKISDTGKRLLADAGFTVVDPVRHEDEVS